MKKINLRFHRIAALSLLLAGVSPAPAQITIDELVQQARIVEGPVAVRDLPRWQGARKLVMYGLWLDVVDEGLIPPGVEVVKTSDKALALEHMKDADVLIGSCDADLIAAAPRLVWLQIESAGAERCLQVERIGNGDVVMTNMQKMSSPVIAEHAISMAMALGRNIPQLVGAMRSRDWRTSAAATDGMAPIAGKRLLVAGLGGIGTEVARLGDALGMYVSGTRNSSRSGPDFIDYVGLSGELNELAATADIIVNALPLTESTRAMFDAEFFAAAKRGAIFINVGRGQTVVTDDLVAALESGQIAGAGLDVTDPEPLPPESPLWLRDDVIITPHVAYRGGEVERHAVLAHENIRRYIAGERLLNVVDPEKGY